MLNQMDTYRINLENINIPDLDIEKSNKEGILFKSYQRSKKGARWEPLCDETSILHAFSCLENSSEPFVSVWEVGENGNYLYWSNEYPAVFNEIG